MPYITKKEQEHFDRLKQLENSGHLLSLDGLRLIIRSCDGDPEKVGKHFMGVYAEWRSKRRA